MTTIVTRAGKGSPLTNNEVDSNFTNLNTAKVEPLASVTNNAVTRFNGTTGTSVKNSVVTIDDSGNEAGTLSKSFTPTTAPSYVEGLQWYDSTQKALTYFNDVPNNQVHIGQEVQLKVVNNTGSSIANGAPVYVTGTSSGQSYPNIALAKADASSTSAVLGLTNGTIASGAVGYVCTAGLLTPCNTGSFTVGQVLYLSPYSAGQLMNTVPPTGYAVQIGVVAYANSPNGSIYVKQTTPLAVSASTIIGQVAVANGGTGASTLTGYVKGSGTSAMTASSTIPTTDLSGTVTNAQLANSNITINGNATALGGSVSVGTVTSVTGTAPVVSSGGNTPAISMAKATSLVDGYLSAIDWNTFNNKQPAGSYLTSAVTSATAGTGISVSASTGAVTFSNTGVTSLTTSSGLSTNTSATGAVSVTNTGVTSIVAGTGISISGATGAVTVTNTVTGATITDDTTTAATYYPLFSTATTGSLSAVRVSSTKYTYNPSTGVLSATVHTSTSDERLKTNWRPVAANFVSQLANVKSGIFDRTDFSTTDVGVGAQSLQPLLPQAVITSEDGYLSVNYGGAALVAAIELAKVVEELRAEIAVLKAKVGE